MKSTRLTGVLGGLLCALGCLFTSFASQFHQLFFSYGAFIGKERLKPNNRSIFRALLHANIYLYLHIIGVGVGLSRDASTLMVGQYFKRKREMVEIFVVSGSGFGIILMSLVVHVAIT